MPKEGTIRGFLPPFYNRAVGPAVTEPGKWESRSDQAFLEMLIHAMPPGTDLNLSDMVSLPHIWGQTLAFTVAWRDESHQMHKTVRGEWRGLLALIGLAGWEDWPVHVSEVNLTQLSERPFLTSSDPFSQSVASQPQPNFAKVVKNSLPDNAAIGAPGWNSSAVILYDRNAVSRPERTASARPVGFCAPRSLVVPARNYRGVLDGRVSWQSDRRGGYPLRDPLDCDGRCVLSRVQLKVLKDYIEKVHEQVLEEARKRVESDSQYVGFLIKMLTDYRSDIEKNLEKYFVTAPSSDHLLGAWDPERFRGFSGPYFNVLAMIPGRPLDQVPKETFINAVEAISPDFKGVVLYGESMIREPGLTSRDVLVWGANTLADLGDEPIHFNRPPDADTLPAPERRGNLLAQRRVRELVKKAAQKEGYLLLHADELFYPQILRMEDTPEGHNPHWDGWLPPLRPLALALFSAQYIRDHLSIEDIGGSIRVTLRLTGEQLDGHVGIGLRKRLEKTYDKGTNAVKPPAVLAVWPNFISPEWHHYGVFHLRDSEAEMDVQALPQTVDWLPKFIETWKNGDDLDTFFENLPQCRDYMATGEGLDENCGKKAFRGSWFYGRPEAVVGVAGGGFGPQRQGLLLLPPVETITASGQEAIIGLDIGSTNTAVAWFLPGVNHREDGAWQIDIEPMLTFLFRSTKEQRKRVESVFGFPSEKKSTPFLSLMKERKQVKDLSRDIERDVAHCGGKTMTVVRDRILPAIHYRIPWRLLDTLDIGSLEKDRRIGETYICDLKWAQRKKETDLFFEAIEQYLILLMRLIGAGVVSRGLTLRTTHWRFSYPETFTASEVTSFREIVDRQILRLNQRGEVADRETLPPPKASMARRECDSVVSYFVRKFDAVAQSNTLVVFDVGGRNTDVVIWHRNKIKWNGTLSIASRHMMIDFIMANPHIIHPIFGHDLSDQYRQEITKNKDRDVDLCRMLTELLVQDTRFLDWQARAREPQRDAGVIARLRDMATFALAGLLYYTALAFAQTLKQSDGSGDFDEIRGNRQMSIQLCFGGMGSKLFSRFVDRSLDESLIKWFYETIAHFIGSNSDGGKLPDVHIYPPIIFNDRAKREVSEGLLLDLPGGGGNNSAAPSNPGVSVTGNQQALFRSKRAPLYVGEALYLQPSGKAKDGDGAQQLKALSDYITDDDMKGEKVWIVSELKQFQEFIKKFQENFQIKLGANGEFADETKLASQILGVTQKDFSNECEWANKDYQRFYRNGDGRTYQPQPVFILALRATLELLNRQSQQP